jgi:hypothetical protein
MKFPGKVHLYKKYEEDHDVEIPSLGIYTKGENFKEAMNKAIEAVEDLLNIKVKIEIYGLRGEFMITSKELKPLILRFIEIELEH